MAMAAAAGSEVRSGGMTKDERLVIFASSLGTVFEWYDFYMYGSLAGFSARNSSPPSAATRDIFALLAFAAGFRYVHSAPSSSDASATSIGRKYTFLVTMTLMGVGTFFIGLLPGTSSHRLCSAGHADRCCGWSRAWRSVANMVAPPPMSRSTLLRQTRLLHVVHSDHRDARPVSSLLLILVHP